MLNDYIFEREQGASFIILLVVSGVCLIIHLSIGRKLSILALRMDTINSEGNLKDKKHFLKPYSKVRHYFDNEYDRANPITSEEKTKEYLRWIFGKFFKSAKSSLFDQKSDLMLFSPTSVTPLLIVDVSEWIFDQQRVLRKNDRRYGP